MVERREYELFVGCGEIEKKDFLLKIQWNK